MSLIQYQDKYPKLHPDAIVMDGTHIIGEVTLASGANVWFGSVLRGDIAPIIVGEDTNIQDNSTVHVDFDTPTIIGARVTVGHGAILHGCVIEDDCLIGMGATVLNGAVIERGSIIGAGALVSPGTRIAAGSLAVGLPAKVIKQLGEDALTEIRKSAAHYVEFACQY